MSNLSQFFSGAKPPKALIGGTPNGGYTYDIGTVLSSTGFSIPTYSSGTMTAGVYKNILSVTGDGVLNFVAFATSSGTRSISLRITIDGVVVYDATTTSGTGRGLVGAGSMAYVSGSYMSLSLDQIPFNVSLLIDVASSDTTGGPVAISYRTN